MEMVLRVCAIRFDSLSVVSVILKALAAYGMLDLLNFYQAHWCGWLTRRPAIKYA